MAWEHTLLEKSEDELNEKKTWEEPVKIAGIETYMYNIYIIKLWQFLRIQPVDYIIFV